MNSWISELSGIETLNSIKESLKTITDFLNLLIHPIKIVALIWNWTVEWSYILCLMVALFAVITYILGYKKFAKLAPTSIIIYTILQAIGKVVIK